MTAGGNTPNSPPAPAGAWPYTSQRLAELMVAHGVLPPATVSDLIAHASSKGISLVDAKERMARWRQAAEPTQQQYVQWSVPVPGKIVPLQCLVRVDERWLVTKVSWVDPR